jgi:hypothetical protein
LSRRLGRECLRLGLRLLFLNHRRRLVGQGRLGLRLGGRRRPGLDDRLLLGRLLWGRLLRGRLLGVGAGHGPLVLLGRLLVWVLGLGHLACSWGPLDAAEHQTVRAGCAPAERNLSKS